MSQFIRLVTYNIRKGKGASGRSTAGVTALGDALRGISPDIVLCQEVFHGGTPDSEQSTELASLLNLRCYYEPNKRRRIGHHGNATFLQHDVAVAQNYDISTNFIERRGALYVRARVHGCTVHIVNAHLGLNTRQRLAQVRRIAAIVSDNAANGEPVVLAGDFNDWNGRVDRVLVSELGFVDALGHMPKEHVCTWHARRPLLNLDRVYLRNVRAVTGRRVDGKPWHELSDHLPVAVELEIPALSQAA